MLRTNHGGHVDLTKFVALGLATTCALPKENPHQKNTRMQHAHVQEVLLSPCSNRGSTMREPKQKARHIAFKYLPGLAEQHAKLLLRGTAAQCFNSFKKNASVFANAAWGLLPRAAFNCFQEEPVSKNGRQQERPWKLPCKTAISLNACET